jgi:hypothetical protein
MSVPLSEYEQRVLDQLEQQLASEDPKLGSKMSAPQSSRRGRVILGVTGIVLGLVVLVVGMVVSQVWVSIIGFLVMFAGAYAALSSPRGPKGSGGGGGGGAAGPKGPKAKGPGKSKLNERFEKRWEDRGGDL